MNSQDSAAVLRHYNRHAESWRENKSLQPNQLDAFGLLEIELDLPEPVIQKLESIGRAIIIDAMVSEKFAELDPVRLRSD
jgi:hypothetical protein